MTRRRATCAVVVLIVGLAGLGGCSSDDDEAIANSTARNPPGAVTLVPALTTAPPTPPTAPPTTSVMPAPTTAPSVAPSIDDLLTRDRPLAIAHQGGDNMLPSSTLFAFGEAVGYGVDVLELDVHRSADGELVVIHDATVDRTTEAEGAVASMTADELAALDAAYRFRPECTDCLAADGPEFPYRGIRTGDRPPPDGYSADDFAVATLRQVAERLPHVPLDIEIKDGVATVEPLVSELRALDRAESVVVASFDQAVIDEVRRVAPEIEVSPGEQALLDYLGGTPLDGYRIAQIPPDYNGADIMTPAVLGKLRADGLAVWVFMNGAEQETSGFYRLLKAKGVDGLIVGRPDLAVAARDAS